jgi:hypothetical protein
MAIQQTARMTACFSACLYENLSAWAIKPKGLAKLTFSQPEDVHAVEIKPL